MRDVIWMILFLVSIVLGAVVLHEVKDKEWSAWAARCERANAVPIIGLNGVEYCVGKEAIR